MDAHLFRKETVEAVGAVLRDSERTLAERFRALFTLRNIATAQAQDQIAQCFSDPSALLQHECAYCLGQVGDPHAAPVLAAVLQDLTQQPMVRHEAAEALGAIGDPSARDVLRKYASDGAREVAETCQLALNRIEWLADKDGGKFHDNSPYHSVDPAPPRTEGSVEEWHAQLMDTSLSLFQRYRAMFALRNRGGREAALALADGLQDGSALFKHEVAYVLGQMQEEAAVRGLAERLGDLSENPMVRHECAEALGSIASEECLAVLRRFLGDKERVVRESCEVALDMWKHHNRGDFQYANTLSTVTAASKQQ